MSAKNARLLRKIAALTGRTDDYIKKQVKQMTPIQRQTYMIYIKTHFKREKEKLLGV